MNPNEKDRIIAATIHGLKACGIKGTNLDELVRKLGVSKKTIYHFFNTKEDLLVAAIDREFEDNLFDLKIISSMKMSRYEKLGSSLLLVSQRLFEASYQVKKELSSHVLLHKEFGKGVERVIDHLVAAYFPGGAEEDRILLLSLIDVMIKGAIHEMGSATEKHIREHVIPFYLQAWETREAASNAGWATNRLNTCISS